MRYVLPRHPREGYDGGLQPRADACGARNKWAGLRSYEPHNQRVGRRSFPKPQSLASPSAWKRPRRKGAFPLKNEMDIEIVLRVGCPGCSSHVCLDLGEQGSSCLTHVTAF